MNNKLSQKINYLRKTEIQLLDKVIFYWTLFMSQSNLDSLTSYFKNSEEKNTPSVL